MKDKEYQAELRKLHGELVAMQEWVKATGAKLCIVFEGRDTAGKGGTIKAITERVSPRVFRVVALPTPTERERSQMHIQRYVPHFPAAGEVVIFDRSWYNRAGVERVMGFCTEEEAAQFLKLIPAVERAMADSGIVLFKYWLEVGSDEQTRRLERRIDNRARSGSCRTWTWRRTAGGTTTRTLATICSRRRTRRGRRGTWRTRTTRGPAGSTSSPICSHTCPTSPVHPTTSRCPSARRRAATASLVSRSAAFRRNSGQVLGDRNDAGTGGDRGA